jgi:hypothetical protein
MAGFCHRCSPRNSGHGMGCSELSASPRAADEAGRGGGAAREGALPPAKAVLGRRRRTRPREAAGQRAHTRLGASWGETEREVGENGGSGARGASARGASDGTFEAFCGMNSTELTCEARFELPNPAWLSSLFRMRSAVLS